MTPQQSHNLKLAIAQFAETTAMLEHAKKLGSSRLELALEQRDRARNEVFEMIDNLTEE